MSLIAKETSERIPPLEAGIYEAVCTQLIDLGRQYSKQFDSTYHKIRIVWDVIGETVTVGEKTWPRTVFVDLTNSLDEKSNLRKILVSWRGREFTPDELKGFNLANILGAGCQVQIIHKSNDKGVYANVQTVLPFPKGKTVPQVEPVIFDLSEPDTYPVFDTLPKYLQKRIAESEEFDDTGLQLSDDDAEDGQAGSRVPVGVGAGTGNPGDFTEIGDDGDLPF